jgi:cytidyltransferase-like protein
MKHIKLFEQFINESVEKSLITPGKKVSFMPGRFQPFHKGHIAALKRTAEKLGHPVIPIQILSKKDKSPFPERLLQRIGDDVAKNNDFIENYYLYPNSYGRTVIPWFVRYLRDNGYEAVGFGAGSDRIKAYQPQVNYITSDKTDTEVLPNFKMELVDVREEDGPSGTKVREALKNGDEAAFKEMVPSYLHKYYKELKKYV